MGYVRECETPALDNEPTVAGLTVERLADGTLNARSSWNSSQGLRGNAAQP
jgi:hypothetical protein